MFSRPAIASVLLLFVVQLHAQKLTYYQSDFPVVLKANGDTLQMPFAGGLASPGFANMDLNFDGVQDLVVYDRIDDKIMTFLNNGDQKNPRYYYAPQYADLFPHAHNFVQLVDYNHDGLKDFWTYSPLGGGMEVYTNTSKNHKISFKLFSQQLYYKTTYGTDTISTNLYIANVDIPSVIDVNGDGNTDILSVFILGGYIYYYCNRATNPDSLDYWLCDQCWGKFKESYTSNSVRLGVSCPRVNFKGGGGGVKNKKHIGSTLLALDLDGDGDLDMIRGDIGFPNLVMTINGRIQNGHQAWPVDSMISIDSTYPKQDKPVDIDYFASSYHVDVNNDGARDFIASTFDPQNGHWLNQIWLYKNDGTDDNPDFHFVKKNFLQDQMIDEGGLSDPVFADVNGDGKMDLLIATPGDIVVTHDSADRIVLYENIGTNHKPVFKMTNNDFLSLQSQGIMGLSPAFGDLNGDGATDLLIGTADGRLIYYENMAGPGKPMNLKKITDHYGGLTNVGQYLTPCIADLNNDHKNDLIIGEQLGNVNYYENTGTATNPSYTLITDSLGHIRTNDSIYQYVYDNQGHVIDTTYYFNYTGYSSPIIADINNDGKPELITGSQGGHVFIFEIDTPYTKPWKLYGNVFYSYGLQRKIFKDFGAFSRVAVAQLNADSIPDMVIGNARGGLNFYGSINSGVVEPHLGIQPVVKKEPASIFRIYPNPTKKQFHLRITQMNPGSEYNLEVLNVLGQVVLKSSMNGYIEKTLNMSNAKSGVYIIQIKETARTGLTRMYYKKVILE